MNNFRFFMPADCYFGRGCIDANKNAMVKLGKKAMVVTGRSSAKKNGAQKDVTDALDALDIKWVLFDEIGENPDVETVERAAKIAIEEGVATPYALDNISERAQMFVEPGTKVYEGMIVGMNSRSDDMEVNPCKAKKATNMRAAGNDDAVKLAPPRIFTLEEALEFIEEDELVEITPDDIRLRKKLLKEIERRRAGR